MLSFPFSLYFLQQMETYKAFFISDTDRIQQEERNTDPYSGTVFTASSSSHLYHPFRMFCTPHSYLGELLADVVARQTDRMHELVDCIFSGHKFSAEYLCFYSLVPCFFFIP
jgi:hypothetical protein